MKTRFFSSLLALSVFACSAAYAAEGQLSDGDAKFVKNAVMSGKSEIKIAELGVKKAENAEVKSLAEAMIKDHTTINGELEKLATAKGVTLSTSGDPKTEETIKELEKESGKDFDKDFLDALEKGHKKSVDAYEDASKDAKDGELKTWAGKTLPLIQGHLKHIETAKKNLK